MKSFVSALALVCIAATAGAQVGHLPEQSPYRDLENSQEMTFLYGYFNAGNDPIGVAPQNGPMFGARYQIHVGGPAFMMARWGHVLSTRKVVEELKQELPRIDQFATLSPVPGFRRWVERQYDGPEPPPVDKEALSDPETWLNSEASAVFEEPLTRLCARYLTETEPGRGPSDPVARFHLGNGARLERINAAADSSAKGRVQSFGLMANYLYEPEDIIANHQAFASSRKVARSDEIGALLTPSIAPARPGSLSLVR